MSEIEIKEIISIYKSKELHSLSFCELKEFRKYLLLDGDEVLGEKIYSLMEALVREGKVSDEEMLGAAYL
tara:strand:+ start:111 stop:320 length:210 start_codon:yes stop_codon:yes gene_type:complete